MRINAGFVPCLLAMLAASERATDSASQHVTASTRASASASPDMAASKRATASASPDMEASERASDSASPDMAAIKRTSNFAAPTEVAGEQTSDKASRKQAVGEHSGDKASPKQASGDHPYFANPLFPPKYYRMQEMIPKGIDWFRPTAREFNKKGVLHDAMESAKRAADLIKDVAWETSDSLDKHDANVKQLREQVDRNTFLVDNLDKRMLYELTQLDKKRMHTSVDAIDGLYTGQYAEDAGPEGPTTA